jgi:hypothetical protein
MHGEKVMTDQKKQYDAHWHVVVSELSSVFQGAGYGVGLYRAIKDEKLKGKPLMMAFVCGGCLGGFVAAADKLAMSHLEQRPTTPSIPCPRCGETVGHDYDGLRRGTS